MSDVQLLLGFSESAESIARLDGATTTFLANLSDGIAADTSASLTALSQSSDSGSSGGSGGGGGESEGSGGGGGGYARPLDDTVKDYDLDLKTFGFAEVTDDASQDDGDKLIALDSNDSVTLLGVNLGDFNSGDGII